MEENDYGYVLSSRDVNIDDERKKQLIKKLESAISKRNTIASYMILEISKESDELEFMYSWINENGIKVRSFDGEIGEIYDNYEHIGRYGQTLKPEPIPIGRQTEYFRRMEIGNQADATIEQKRDGKKARKEFIAANIKLAEWVLNSEKVNNMLAVVNKFGNAKDVIENKKEYAYEGLIKAVDSFDYKKTYTDNSGKQRYYAFSTYATKAIYNSLIDAIYRRHKQTIIIIEKIMELEDCEKKFENKGVKPSIKELANSMGASENEIEKLRKQRDFFKIKGKEIQRYEGLQEYDDDEERIISYLDNSDGIQIIGNGTRVCGQKGISGPRYEDTGYIVDGIYVDFGDDGNEKVKVNMNNTKAEKVYVERVAGYADFVRVLKETLATLKEKQRFIVLAKFGMLTGEEITLTKIGKMLNCTHESVSQSLNRSLKRMRNPSKNKNLAEFLEDVPFMNYIKRQKPIIDPNTPIENMFNEFLKVEAIRRASEQERNNVMANLENSGKTVEDESKASSNKIVESEKTVYEDIER